MPEEIVQLNEEVIKGQIRELVRGSVEETLKEQLEAEAEQLTHAARYERNEQRQGYCQRQFANVRKRRRNFVVFRRGWGKKTKRFLAQKECSRFAVSDA